MTPATPEPHTVHPDPGPATPDVPRGGAVQPGRADARRNRDRVLAAAERLFAEHGLATRLDQVAKAAEVGTGTVYRNFPSKDDLLQAVVQRRVEHLNEHARRAEATEDPGEAFFGFLAYVMEHTLVNKALSEALGAHGAWSAGVRSRPGCGSFDTAIGPLLARAQQAGVVRTDVTVDDVVALIAGYATMAGHHTAPDGPQRMAALLWSALLAGAPLAPVPGAAPASVGGAARNETKAGNETELAATSRNETKPVASPATCPVCGQPVTWSGTGRPPRYCSPTCRLRAHRAARRQLRG